MPTNTNRRHALFICSGIGDATSGLEIDMNDPTVVSTFAGCMSGLTGAFGGMNFGVPVRLSPDAKMARHWGAQAYHTKASERSEFPTLTGSPPTVKEGLCNDYSMLGLRALRDGEPASSVNGVVCMAYDDSELAAAKRFFARFGNATLARFPKTMFQKISWQSMPSDVDWIYCVVTMDSAFEPPTYESPILQTYLDQVCSDFLAYGEDFLEEFLQSTRSWSTFWLNNRIEDLTSAIDQADPSRETETLDAILQAHAPLISQRQTITCYALKALGTDTTSPTLSTTSPSIFTSMIKQSETKFFCFGMGSLINTPSRVGTAGKVAQCAIPIAVTASYDFCPCWNFQNRAGGSQLTAGGMILRHDPRNQNPLAETAGVVYPGPTNEAAMAAQDEREVGYTRYNIPTEYIRSLNWCDIPDGITVFQYVPNTELADDHPSRARNKEDGSLTGRATFPPRDYPLPQTYVDVCIKGCLEYSTEFAAKWIAGFVGWPSPQDANHHFWLNDRPMARTGWVREPRFREVDELLVSEIPDSFSCRRLPAEYARHYAEGDDATTDVSYISYNAGTRPPTQAADQTPTHFIFEYDDRISAAQWAKVITQADIEQGIACRLKSTAGYRRSFCFKVDEGFTAPALVVADDASQARPVNGVMYAAPNSWISDDNGPPEESKDPFAGKGLSRVELSTSEIHVLANFMSLPSDAKVYTYIVTTPSLPSYDYPIRQTVVDTILGACLEHSVDNDFCAEWIDTTDGWKNPDGKCFWFNDRIIARRPWMALGGSYKIFDRLVYESTSPCVPSGVLLERRLAEEYPLLQKMK